MSGPTRWSRPGDRVSGGRRSGDLRALAGAFLKLGTIAFGGPAAHIAFMEGEFVVRRQWLTREAFLDLVGMASVIPGPSSTEVAIFVGYKRAGWRGLVVAGCAFILPAAILVTALAWAYVRFGSVPTLAGVLYGVKAAVVAVIAQALAGLGRTALKNRWLAALGLAAAVANWAGAPPLYVLIGAGVVALGAAALGSRARSASAWIIPLAGECPKPIAATSVLAYAAARGGLFTGATGAVALSKLFVVFLKVGGVVFGSGYVLLAFLRADVVERLHWLTDRQLVDAIAVGQVTPGPVFTTATFIGYLVAGVPGAVVATVGIFLPSFVLVALSGPLLARIRTSPVFGAVLDAINAASLALMAVVMAHIARASIVDLATAIVAAASALILFTRKASATWVIAAAAAIGVAVKWGAR